MLCRCGGYARILKTEENRRRRKCGSCGRAFFTVELRESEVDQLGAQALKRLVNDITVNRARATLREKGYLR